MSEGNGIDNNRHTAPKAVAESAESLGPRAESKESVNKESEAALTPDANKITFTKNENESVVHIGEVAEVSFAGMGKEELMKYANDPYWVRVRWALFILFWLAWIAMLVGAIVIVVLAPKCPPPKPLTFWQKGVVYHTEIQAYQDGEPNQDGKGDLKGIIGRLGHLEQLGVNMLVLPPIYQQDENEPYGFGVVDFESVSPTYGTMEDLKNLVQAAEAHKGMKVILDFIPNHSSKKHKWFTSSTTQTSEYADYYVWKDCGDSGTNLPNAWTNVFNSSAWTFDPIRKQCYYHAYGPNQPDLNLWSAKVQNELDKILRTWLDLGVAGFRLLSVPFLYESDSNATHLPESYEFVGRVRNILEEYEEKDGVERLLLVDPDNYASLQELIDYYGTNETTPLSELPINNNLIYNTSDSTAAHLRTVISDYLMALPSWGWPTWVVSNRDRSRIATRLGNRKNLSDAFAMMQMLMPGTPVMYYGDEIGMEDVAGDTNEDCSVGSPLTETYSCNKARSPFQWDDTPNTAGFTNATTPWHPVAPPAVLQEINAKAQTGDRESHFGIYQALVALRNQPAIMHGNFTFPECEAANNEKILSFVRIRKGSPGYIVTVNLSPNMEYASFEKVEGVPADASVVIRSSMSVNDTTAIGQPVDTNKVPLGAYEGLVLSFAPNV